MLTLDIKHQSEYSRGQLLLRAFFGWLYIYIPHYIVLCLLSIIYCFMRLGAFFIILFTGVTPQWYYEWTVKLGRWGLRVAARFMHLSDGYPAFGLDSQDENTKFDIEFWQIGRGEMLLRTFLGGIYAGIPHMICLYVRMIATLFIALACFFIVLFTGKYPENLHRFNVGTIRWGVRLNLFLSWLYKDYPPFAGKPDDKVGFEFEEAKQ